MKRGLIALTVGLTVGLGTAAPAMATQTLAASGDATSVSPTSADLNGIVYRERVGARWLFEYSTDRGFDQAVESTVPLAMTGRLSAVEAEVTGLTPATAYYWRVVLTVRSGVQTVQTYGATKLLTTTPAGRTTAAASRRSIARRAR